MKNKGFSFAEVMITITIIGVVAAITMPVIFGDYREKENETRYLKIRNVISDAFKRLMFNEQTYSLTFTPIIDCYKADIEEEAQISCFDNVTKSVFNVMKDSYTNPEILTGLKTNQFKTYYIGSVNDILIPKALADEGDEPAQNTQNDENIQTPWQNVVYAFMTIDGFIFGYEKNALFDEFNNIEGFYMVVAKDKVKVSTKCYRFLINETGITKDVSNEITQTASQSG